jgi:hypothetical protein
MGWQVRFGVAHSTAATRVSRTATWPASTGWVKYGGRINGIAVRVGNTHRFVYWLPVETRAR